MKKILVFILIASSVSLSDSVGVNFEIDQLIKKYNPDVAYFKELNDIRSSYVFSDNSFLFFDDNVIYDDKETEAEKIQNKNTLSELLNTQSLAYDAIQTAILVEKLTEAYKEWAGTKYLWGGDSKKGIDCSAFVRRIFRKVFNYEMPRVSTSQIQQGTRITKAELKTGDVIFFRPENRSNHTAIYLGDGLFIHSASSKGVSIASINNSYWQKYFKFGVRINGLVTRIV